MPYTLLNARQSFGARRRGSASLGMIFSSGAGLLFALLFYNLVQYIGALQAMQETARATARCITPTDAECRHVEGGRSEEPLREWFAFARAASERTPIDASLRMMSYSAALSALHWTASYHAYESLLYPREYEITAAAIPTVRFEEILPEVIPAGRIEAAYRIESGTAVFRPQYRPNFPQFSEDLHTPPEEWRNRQLPLQFHGAFWSDAKTIGPGEVASFEVSAFVPPLAGAQGGVCLDGDKPCDGAAAAGGQPDVERWRSSAFLAIKAFSEIRALLPGAENGTAVQWADGRNGPGLVLEIEHRGERTEICLGGRATFRNLRAEPKMYNLWIRGPRGAHGGTSPVCPGGDVDHSNLMVPRGASFRIRGYLINRGSKPAVVRAQFNYYFDQYLPETPPPIEVRCRPAPYVGASARRALYPCRPESCSLETCPPAHGAGCMLPALLEQLAESDRLLTAGSGAAPAPRQVRNLACRDVPDPLQTRYTCRSGFDSEPQDVQPRPAQTYKTLCCDQTWAPGPICGESSDPSEDGACAERAAQEFVEPAASCGFRREELWGEAAIVGRSTCANAVPVAVRGACERPLIKNRAAGAEDCPSAYRRLAEIAESTARANDTVPDGRPQFSPDAAFRLLPADEQRLITSFSWTEPVDSAGNALSPGEYRRIERTLPELHYLKSYKRRSGIQQPPPAADFLAAILEDAAGDESSPGYAQFISQLSNRVAVLPAGESAVPITGGYPFVEPVPEIYYGQSGSALRSWDFDRDCRQDLQCDDLQLPGCLSDGSCFPSEEAMLRFFAAKLIPEAADPALDFRFASKIVGRKHLPATTLAELAALQLPRCAPLLLICSSSTDGRAEVVPLGTSREEPEACRDGRYDYCFSRASGGQPAAESASTIIDFELAKSVGMVQFNEIVPYARLRDHCNGDDFAGCTSIEIDQGTSREFAAVRVSYNMPLIFPLDAILGRKILQLDYRKRELIEAAAVGRPAEQTSPAD